MQGQIGRLVAQKFGQDIIAGTGDIFLDSQRHSRYHTHMKNNKNLRNLHVCKYLAVKDTGGHKHLCYLTWLDKENKVEFHHISLKLANALIEAGMDVEG